MALDGDGPALMTPVRPALLLLNAGSSSLKAALYSADGCELLWRDQRSWPGPAAESSSGKVQEALLEGWLLPALEPWWSALHLVGHRVVHGGERFTAPTRLDREALIELERLLPLAPLHNGPALRLIRWLLRLRPELPQWACFDTAFHRTLPPEAHTYALPLRWRQQGLRRYGFHGLSHQHVSAVVPHSRLISCHLGAGCSLCAIRERRSIATTMGFTPLDGLVMATRSGSIDPGVLLHLLRQGVSAAELEQVLQQRSGLLALSQGSSDMRELRGAAAAGDGAAALAIAVFRQSLLQGIGAMAAALGGVDAIALTGGIGEHDGALREELAAALAWLPPFRLIQVAADEEGVMARSLAAR